MPFKEERPLPKRITISLRYEILNYLRASPILRNLFSGNILRQPAYLNIPHRKIGDLPNTDRIMNDAFFLGTYPGIGKVQIEYVLAIIEKFLSR